MKFLAFVPGFFLVFTACTGTMAALPVTPVEQAWHTLVHANRVEWSSRRL
jgi:hypothetical protein